MSVKEAVKIAQTNNFMGLVCCAGVLVRIKFPWCITLIFTILQKVVPALVESVKSAGLVLVTNTSQEASVDATTQSYCMPKGIDGVLKGNGILRFHEMVDM